MTPLLLLDVDGVLNVLGRPGHGGPWPVWRQGRAAAAGSSWPITWAPAVVERLAGWHEQGRAEVQWLTTWGHDANRELRGLLGLPALRVAGTYDSEPEDGAASAAAAGSLAAQSPSAPDRAQRWWKHDVVLRLLRTEPGRRIVWVDDELHDAGGPFRRWADGHPDVVAVGPHPAVGLTPADLQRIEEHLAAGADATPG